MEAAWRVPVGAAVQSPTAVQVRAAEHDTPSRLLPVAPVGFGTGCSCQLVPSQRSASANDPPLVDWNPTAVQALALGHDTARKAVPVGFGVVCTLQFRPFQRSTSGTNTSALDRYSPIAVQARPDEHDTPMNEASVAPVGLGVVCTCQLLPFHRSASATLLPLPLAPLYPTAVQARFLVQETELNRLDVPEEVGVDCRTQLVPFQRSTNGTKPPLVE